MYSVTGSTFRKVDLHVHTPKSLCYSEPGTTAGQIVDAAVAKGLEAIGITDHNTAAAISEIREFAGKKRLFVFPGVELSLKVGHILVIFELDTPLEKLEDFLDDIRIAREKWGDAATMPDDGIEEVFRKMDERGGIAIAAHIERWPSGFLETNEPRRVKMKVHSSQFLSALEITIPESKTLWNAGRVRGFPKKYACIQGSDAHSPRDVGRRPVYIQMDSVSLAALRSAFADYETRILFPDDFTPTG